MGKGYKPEVYRKRNDKYTYEKCSTSLNNKKVWGEAKSFYFPPTRVANFFYLLVKYKIGKGVERQALFTTLVMGK